MGAAAAQGEVRMRFAPVHKAEIVKTNLPHLETRERRHWGG